MAKNIREVINKLPKKDQQVIKKRSTELIEQEMSLRQLRMAREKSQKDLAKKLGVKQAAVSRLEHRTDVYLSTLRSYVEAMGGRLEITAKFPDLKSIKIRQFCEEAST